MFTVRLPLYNGDNVQLNGVCPGKITSVFPEYPIQCRVEDDIHAAFIQQGGNPDDLPKLPKYSGGEVDFIMPPGLTIYIGQSSLMLMVQEESFEGRTKFSLQLKIT